MQHNELKQFVRTAEKARTFDPLQQRQQQVLQQFIELVDVHIAQAVTRGETNVAVPITSHYQSVNDQEHLRSIVVSTLYGLGYNTHFGKNGNSPSWTLYVSWKGYND